MKRILKKIFSFLSIFSYGFYSYFVGIFDLLNKFIFKLFNKRSKRVDKVIDHFKMRQRQPQFFMLLCIYVVGFSMIFDMVYKIPVANVNNSKYLSDISVTKKINDNNVLDDNVVSTQEDNNLYRKYSSYSLDEVSVNDLKLTNDDVIGWISVDSTSINYPIVQSEDNDYYLNHNIYKSFTTDGWVFMDYRNNINQLSSNNIIYGHNLLNNTAFGSIPNMLKNKYLNNSDKSIIILTDQKKYVFKIFSIYEIKTEVYYLQTTFGDNEEYKSFIDTLVGRNQTKINESVGVDDKLLTLSTCNFDNTGRIVVHAKLISETEI